MDLRVAVIGGSPAVYTSPTLEKRTPTADIGLFEAEPAGDLGLWRGVLGTRRWIPARRYEPRHRRRHRAKLERWKNITSPCAGESAVEASASHRLAGLRCDILQQRVRAVGAPRFDYRDPVGR